jgi:lipopolysaccharide assembly outer membrane protein LptD (OstA)
MNIRRGFVILVLALLCGPALSLAARGGAEEAAAGGSAEPAAPDAGAAAGESAAGTEDAAPEAAAGETAAEETEAAAGEAAAEETPVEDAAGEETEAAAEPPPAGEDGPAAPGAGDAETAADDDEAAVGEAAAEEEAPPLDPAMKIIDMDIRTASLMELAAWCRELGLSEGGGREELARRLREHFKLTESGAAEEEADQKIIIIESARSTQYFTLEVVDEEYARLQGDVVLSLKDGDVVHRIKAWEILYNRTRNLMTATGGVEYVKESGETVETFRGESITVNLDNWSSVFLDGISERSLQSDNTTYRFAGTVISRSDEEVTVLNRASISNANNPEALWSLHASKIWLLPGSDFAIFNAVLKVGEIPVLYFPFFHYPADEMIFHPVLGYRSREGNFLQTTTYILGRAKASSTSESSITKILGNSADMEKRREGIFLRSTGKKIKDPNTTSLKVLADFYVNLGAYLGVDLAVPAKGVLGAVDFSAGTGFTRTVVPMTLADGSSSYTPFASYDGTSEWNRAKFISWDVPFRYRLKTTGSLSGRFGSLSWGFPYYSDPFVDRDFLDRAEEMDWINMIQEGAALQGAETTVSENLLGAYEWRLSGSIRPSLPSLAPYISDISLSSFSSTVNFRTRSLDTTHPSYNKDAPSRSFFYPDKVSLYSLSGSLSGTPLTLGGGQTGQTIQTGRAPEEQGAGTGAEDPLKNIGVPRSPWGTAEPEQKPPETDKLLPPALSYRFDLPRTGGPQFSLDYRITPTAASELQFRSSQTNWPEYDTIDWSEVSSLLTTVGGDAGITLNLNHANGGAYTNALTFSGAGSWQDYTYLNEEAEEYSKLPGYGLPAAPAVPDPEKITEARRQIYSQTYFTTSYGYTGIVRPFYRSAVWGSSSLQYSFRGLLAKSAFTGTGDEPEWEVKYGAWDEENLESHQFSANAAASVMDHVQSLVFTADLPPEEAAVSGNATFRVWITETNAHIRVLRPADEGRRKIEPLYATETLRFGNLGSVQQYLVFDPDIKELTTLTSSLSLAGFTASFTMIRTRPYLLNYNGSADPSKPDGWIQLPDEGLYPRDLSLGYNRSFRKDGLWNKRLNFSVNINTSLFMDLQRYTYSRFNFTLGFTTGIAHFLDLTLSATSDNSVIYRYFKDWSFFNMPGSLPSGEQDNVFIDLANSFRFDDEAKRRSSGFKLKNFNLSATHHLGDWKATLGVSLTPYLPSGSNRYKFSNEISFVVQWVPISEIKTDMQYTRDEKWIVK